MPAISVFDIFKIGVGPSSSHTLGPWRAAQRSVRRWQELGLFDSIVAVRVDLYGSLAKTGRGHMTDVAVMLGLLGRGPGHLPDRGDTDPHRSHSQLAGDPRLAAGCPVRLRSGHGLPLQCPHHLSAPPQCLDVHGHPGRRLELRGDLLLHRRRLHRAGGRVGAGGTVGHAAVPDRIAPRTCSGYCEAHGLTIPEVVWRNELAWRTAEEIREGLSAIWETMRDCAFRGCRTRRHPARGLGVVRRAAGLSESCSGPRPGPTRRLLDRRRSVPGARHSSRPSRG